MLIKHLQEGNSYGIWLKHQARQVPATGAGPWLENSPTVGDNWKLPRLEGLGAPHPTLTDLMRRAPASIT
ncbi:hypothetical protein HBB16_08965 [Pseudonocardia sp. MCCB 268]|nr:hypothetical protein [Pseudonocardia cytotoxica]